MSFLDESVTARDAQVAGEGGAPQERDQTHAPDRFDFRGRLYLFASDGCLCLRPKNTAQSALAAAEDAKGQAEKDKTRH